MKIRGPRPRARVYDRDPKPGSIFAQVLRDNDAILRALAASEREDRAREERERQAREDTAEDPPSPPTSPRRS